MTTNLYFKMYLPACMVYYPKNINSGIAQFCVDFPTKKIQSEIWTHPPTSIVICFFLNFSNFAKPLKSLLSIIPTTRGRKMQLSTSKVTQTNIPPRENVSYCKETQTPVEPMDGEYYWRRLVCSHLSIFKHYSERISITFWENISSFSYICFRNGFCGRIITCKIAF